MAPVVELMRSAAVSEANGPEAGLEIVDRLTGLEDYPYLYSARAELLRRLGRTADAREAYAWAIEPAHDETERRLSECRRGEVSVPRSSSSPRRRTSAPARSTEPG